MMDFLTIITPEGLSIRRRIDTKILRIGRSADNDLVLPDPTVSRTHATIVKGEDGYIFTDLKSRAGSFVNDQRVSEPMPLQPGDRLRLGTTQLEFNSWLQTPVEFNEEPLPGGKGSTFLPIEEALRTPKPELTERKTVTPLPRSAVEESLKENLVDTEEDLFRVTPENFAAVSSASLSSFVDLLVAEDLLLQQPLKEILDKVMKIVSRTIPYERGTALVFDDNGEVAFQAVRSRDKSDSSISISRSVIDHVNREHQAILVNDPRTHPLVKKSKRLAGDQVHGLMCVPIWNKQKVFGVIYVHRGQTDPPFTERDLRVLSFLANITAIRVETTRLSDEAKKLEDFREAVAIQKSFLPSESPSIPGYRISGNTVPCYEVGGDSYDFLHLNDGRHAFLVADVAGHGVASALLMSNAQASLRALAKSEGPSGGTFAVLNDLLCSSFPENRFVSCFCGVLEPSRHGLTYINAGHNPPWIVRSGGEAKQLELSNLFLGCLPGINFEEKQVELGKGDILVTFSDGVIEAENPKGERFGDERLVDLLREFRHLSPSEIIGNILTAIDQFRAETAQTDDITLVVLQRQS